MKIILPAIIFASFPLTLLGSTVYFSPSSVSVRPGQLVTAQIFVDPQGTAYTSKVVLSFTPEVLSYSSFTQASGWLPLSQSGYDSVDNSNSSLIKTAGYPGGLSSSKIFGTVTFIANKAGTASISVSDSTQILDSSNQNTFTGGSGLSISIVEIKDVVVPPSVSNPPRPLLKAKSSELLPAATSTEELATSSAPLSSDLLSAQAFSATTIPYNIIIPVLTFLLGFALGRIRL